MQHYASPKTGSSLLDSTLPSGTPEVLPACYGAGVPPRHCGVMRVLCSFTRHNGRPTPCSNLATVTAVGQVAPSTMSETVETGTPDLRATALAEVRLTWTSNWRANCCTALCAGLVTCSSCGHAGYRARGERGDSGTASQYPSGDTKLAGNTPNEGEL